jgi:glycosyltransferase involved in cell wall biosynthesis
VRLCRSGSVGPDIAVVPFAAQLGRTHRHTRKRLTRSAFEPLKLLTVATWEPRKNLPRLLKAIRAAERVAGVRIELSLVGRKGCFPEYDAEVEALVAAMPHAVHHGPVRDDELVPLYENCHAAIYPSYEEGFGLPVMEALWLGTPCLCHNGSSMAELVPGGGVIAVDMTSEEAIAGALQRLAHEPELLDRAVAEATVRPLTAWRDYTSTVVDRLSQQTNGRAGWAASRRGPGMRCRPAA